MHVTSMHSATSRIYYPVLERIDFIVCRSTCTHVCVAERRQVHLCCLFFFGSGVPRPLSGGMMTESYQGSTQAVVLLHTQSVSAHSATNAHRDKITLFT